ncbi:MAG TPA: tetratricopeptide repeat protein [Thermodesulfobacteriota bacterium]|jgi:tetratricopeptide (TPR) repeat protein|nr:tetratricopeptide repeat protein [Thermodesulfobacteriota bacterium]
MTRTKKIIKKKLKKPDEFITLTERTFLFITHHSRSIAVGAGIVLILLLCIFSFKKWEKKNEENAYQMFHLAVETYEMVSSPYRDGSPQEYRAVLEKFDEVITKYPRTSSGKIAMLFKGNIYLRLGEFDDAIKAYEAFLQKTGKEKLYRSFALDGLGYSYGGKKEYEKAVDAYQRLAGLGEGFQSADAYLGLGRCYEKVGKSKESLENYKSFIRVSKKSEMTNIVLRKISDLGK